MNKFGKRLKEIMDHKGQSAYSLSEATGIPRQTIASYLNENKSVEPGFNNLELLANYFEISAGYFFSDIPVDRYYKLNRLGKLNSKLTMLPSEKLDIVTDILNVYAKHLAGKMIDEEKYA